MPYRYQPVGAIYTPGKDCVFRVWAPLKKKVELVLITGSKKTYTDMQRDERGYWSVSLQNVLPGTRYLFRLDGENEYADPASYSQPEGVHGPSEVVERDFKWTDQEWHGMALSDMIMYELHVGAFTDEGSFAGVISRLDYLLDLGINTIELMPVAQFPGNRNWGYDGVFPFAVQQGYGGRTGLKQLVNVAHKKGIAVVIDVVYNHLGPEGNVLDDFAPYFTQKYKTPWGAAINFDDSWSDGVRHFFFHNVTMWLEEFHIDGLRIDAVHTLFDNSAMHIVQYLKQAATALEERTGRKKVLIAELDLNNPRYINSPTAGGYGLDGQWMDEFHHAIHALLTGERNGYYRDFGCLQHIEKAFRDTYVYTGQYSVCRKQNFGSPTSNPYDQFIVFAQNHDQTGNRMLGERLGALLSFEAVKLFAAAVLLSPYVPLLFMGEEYGEKNPFRFFSSFSDMDLIENTRKGRKEEFRHFGWNGETPDPFAAETFEQSKLRWHIHENEESGLLFRFYQYLIALRKTHPALLARQRNAMFVYPVSENGILAFERKNGDASLLILLNFSNTLQISFPLPFQGKLIFDSSGSDWGGPGGTGISFTVRQGETIGINPYTALIIEKGPS